MIKTKAATPDDCKYIIINDENDFFAAGLIIIIIIIIMVIFKCYFSGELIALS